MKDAKKNELLTSPNENYYLLVLVTLTDFSMISAIVDSLNWSIILGNIC